ERPVALVSALVHVNVAAILAARLAGRRPQIVVTEHNQIARNAARARSTAVRLAHRAVAWIYPWADEIVAVSKGVADSLTTYSGLPGHRGRVVYKPVVTPALQRKAAANPPPPWVRPHRHPVIPPAGPPPRPR